MRAALYLLLVAACGDNRHLADAAVIDAPADAPIDAPSLTPETLFGTGLCLDRACTQISPDVHAYTPRFTLWADTATKRRWMYLPPGTQIDTTDPDHWIFPVGTKFWKEFTRDGVRVETRYIVKLLADDNSTAAWFYVSYAWNATQDATTAVTNGEMNANGTMHDIPSRAQCKQCHESLYPTRVLGFGAIQLDAPSTVGLDLDQLVAAGWLTTAPPAKTGTAHYPLPGTAADQAALGYLHANCGHCHNPTSPTHDMTPIELRLEVGKLGSVAATPAVATTVGKDGMSIIDNGMTYTKIIVAGDPDHSIMAVRMAATTMIHMPKLGSEMTDPAGLAAIRAWISSL